MTWLSKLRISRLKTLLYPRESIDDLLNPVFYRDVFVECVVCAYVMACVIWALMTLHVTSYKPNTTHFGLFAGFIIMLLIEAYGPISGAPLNPAGCWGFFLAGRISLARLVLYTGVEIGGCAAGSTAAFYLSPVDNQKNFTAIKIGHGLIPVHGMFIEAILTFNLLFVALICTDPKRKTSIMPSLPIAWCIGTGIFAAGTHTGGLQNPIVPFGPALVTRDFENHWVYWAGPYLGATFGTMFYLSVVYVKDHYERHPSPPTVEHTGIQNPAHTDHCDDDTPL